MGAEIAAIGAGAGGIIGNLIGAGINQGAREWNNNIKNALSDASLTQYFKDYDKAISDYFLDKQIDYNKWALDYQTNLQNTAYQRAVSDMKAAGINPASLAGVSASSAQSPNPLGVNSSYHSGSQSAVSRSNLLDGVGIGSTINSAVNAMIAKDRDASRLLAAEIVDNAKHEHRMEELKESFEWKQALQAEKHRHDDDVHHNNQLQDYD